jgi:predicted Zn finger-like uncharacterized protein
MPIHVVCPECRSAYDLIDDQRGKKVRCKKCQVVFTAGASQARREDAVREVEAVAERPSRAPVKKAVAPLKARKTAGRAEDDDDDREIRRSPAPRRKKSGGAAPILLIGGLGALVLVVLVGVVGLIVALRWLAKDDAVANPRIVDANGPGDPARPGRLGENPPDNRPPNNNPGIPPPNDKPNPPFQPPPVDNTPPREPEVKDPDPVDKTASKPGPAGGQLAPEVVRKVKHATAMIRVTMPDDGKAWGTGFLGVEKNVLLTNAHVIGMIHPESRAPKNIEVVFDSGDKDERKFGAQILGIDRSSDLAVLKLVLLSGQPAATIPPPLEVKSAADLAETQTLYVFGFPLGEQLGKEITIRRTEVASLRKDNFGTLNRVQVNGGMDPGNSGGPVVDANGDVLGVAVSKIMGTQIDFAIPGDHVRNLLQGRIQTMGIATPYYQNSKVLVPVTIDMLDPLSRVKEVALDVWVGDKGGARPPVIGDAPKSAPGDSTHEHFKLNYQAGKASGEVALPKLPPGKVYWVQPNWVNGQGKGQWAGGNVHAAQEPVERKPVRLAIVQNRGERTLGLKTTNTFAFRGRDDRAFEAAIEMDAAIMEKTTKVEKDRGATMTLQYTGFKIDETVNKQKPPEHVRQKLDNVSKSMGFVGATVVQDTYGNLQQFPINLNAFRGDAQLREDVSDMHEQIQHALEALAVPLPNKEVKYNEQWQHWRTLPIDTPGKFETGAMLMTYTYLGVRKNAAGREEAVLGLEGTLKSTDKESENRLGGKASGTAQIDVATGQVTMAHTDVTVDLTLKSGAKQTGTLTVTLNRTVP